MAMTPRRQCRHTKAEVEPRGGRGDTLRMTNPRDTLDTFIAEVPAGMNRSILVYRRQHGGREFIRWRYWHRHRQHEFWYPDKHRSFVVPLDVAPGLANALEQAASGQSSQMPDWLAKIEASREYRLAALERFHAPESMIEQERRGNQRAPGEPKR